MKGFDARPVPQFGDIVMLAMGTLERDPSNQTYTFLRSQSICNEDDQIDVTCLRKMASNVTALWSVQKVRHRDEKGKYRFELRFGIITMDGQRRHRVGRESPDLPLRQFVAKQEDYPHLFNGQFSDSDLKKRSDFFEDAQLSAGQEERVKTKATPHNEQPPAVPDNDAPFTPSIDRTIFDLLPFFSGGGEDSDHGPLKSHQPRPYSSSFYGGGGLGAGPGGSPYRQPHAMSRPLASGSDYYNYYSHPSTSFAAHPAYRPSRPRPAYSNYNAPSFASLFNPLASGSYNRPVAYKPHPSPEYLRYPDSSYSYSSPYKSYAPPAAYHYTSHHPAVSAQSIAPSYQSSSGGSSPFLSQMLASTANFNPISYFLNRNRPPTVSPVAAARPQVYYQRPPQHISPAYYDYKTAESHQFPKKALYYSPGYEVLGGPGQIHRPTTTLYKDAMNGAYSVHSQKYVPLQQVNSPLVHSQVTLDHSPQFYQHHSAIPAFSPAPSPTASHFPTSPATILSPFHQISNPFLVQHLQVLPVTAQGQQHGQQQFPSQLFSIPLTATSTAFRFPPSIPLHDPEAQNVVQQSNGAAKPTPSQPLPTHGKDIFSIVREPKQRSKFSDPDPLYHNNAKESSPATSTTTSTTSTATNKIQATPKVSYFFPKDEENVFKPVFSAALVPASTVRRNFSEPEFKHILQPQQQQQQHHQYQQASYQKLNNFLVHHGKGSIIYATPSSLPLQTAAAVVKKPQSNIIYGQVVENKVQPPTEYHHHNQHHRESSIKLQLPAPSRGTNQTPVTPTPTKLKATPTRRVSSTPVNLITPPSTTTTSSISAAPSSSSSSSSSTTTTTTRGSTSTTTPKTTTTTTTEPRTFPTMTQRSPRGRQYSRSKVTTTTTEKPVLKWMPKRKRPKQEPTKIAATLNNSGTKLPRPHISNRTRIVAQGSSNRPVMVPLDDVSMGPEEMVFQRRHEKYIQATAASPNFVERSNGGITTQITPRNNKKRKSHVHHSYTNFVTVPTTTTSTTTTTTTSSLGADETIPEPQKNVFTTTSYPVTVTVTSLATNVPPTFTSRQQPSTTPMVESVVHTQERDLFTTSSVAEAANYFLPTMPIPVEGGMAVPLELFELSKAQVSVKPAETDTPDVELFRASHRDEEEEEDEHDDDIEEEDDDNDDVEDDNHRRDEGGEDEDDPEEGESESGLDFIAKSIVATAKKVFSSDTSSNTISGADEDERSQPEAPLEANAKKSKSEGD